MTALVLTFVFTSCLCGRTLQKSLKIVIIYNNIDQLYTKHLISQVVYRYLIFMRFISTKLDW